MFSTTDVRDSAAWPSAIPSVQASPPVHASALAHASPLVQATPSPVAADGSGLATLDAARPAGAVSPPTATACGQPAGVEVSVTLPAGSEIVLSVRPGEAVGLVGPAGSGKTLVVQAAAGLLQLPAVVGPPPETAVTLVVDDATVHEDLSVEATLRYWASVAEPGLFGTDLADRVAGAIDATGLGRWRDTPIEHCHQVVRCAVAVAVALFDRPAVLVLDEPLRKVAARHRQAVLLLLDALRAHGVGLLYATWRESEAAALCDRVITLPDPAGTAVSRAS